MKCPSCQNKTESYICPECGFDFSLWYAGYPALSYINNVEPRVNPSAVKPEIPKSTKKRFKPVLAAAFVALLVVFICIILCGCNSHSNDDETRNKLYLSLIEDYESKYGALSFPTDEEWRASDGKIWAKNARGLCYTKLLDFNNDGCEELLLAYYYDEEGLTTPLSYTVEVWAYTEENIFCAYRSSAFLTGAEGLSVVYGEMNGVNYILQCNTETDWNISFYRFNGEDFVLDHVVDDPSIDFIYENFGLADYVENQHGLSYISLISGDNDNVLSNSISRVKKQLS